MPAGEPQNLSGIALNSSSIALTWDPPLPEGRNGIIIGYTVNITALETGARLQLFSPVPQLTVSVLDAFTTYICIIAGNTIIGRGPFTTELQVRTLPDGMHYNRTALDLLQCKCIGPYRTVHVALYMFTHVLQVNMCFLYVQTRRMQILHCSGLAVG